VGDLVFVGLSQVRESAVFSGIPITERLAPEERTTSTIRETQINLPCAS
jgi:hypothetical protein